MATVDAKINPGWAMKWMIMGAAMILFGGWFWYDSAVAYPAHNVKVAAFAKLQNSQSPDLFDDDGNPAGWSYDAEALADIKTYKNYPDYAAAKGWSKDDPGSPYSDTDIATQRYLAFVTVGLGLAALVFWAINARRVLAADDEALIAPNGTRIEWEKIREIDRTAWDKKGIAIVKYDGGTCKIDDYVFKGADRVLEQVEQNTGL